MPKTYPNLYSNRTSFPFRPLSFPSVVCTRLEVLEDSSATVSQGIVVRSRKADSAPSIIPRVQPGLESAEDDKELCNKNTSAHIP
jgi:hypothetical protein